MAQFFGATVTANAPVTIKPDPVGEINITSATLHGDGAASSKPTFLRICADEGDTFTLAALVPGSREHQRLDVQLGAGNEAIVFSVVGKARVDLTGYVTQPEEYGDVDSDDDEEDDSEEDGALAAGDLDEKELARTMFGTARLAGSDESSYDSSDDESFDDDSEEERAAKLLYADSDDSDEDDDDEDFAGGLIDGEAEEADSDDDSDDDDDEEDDSSSDDDFGIQPVLKKKAAPAPAAPESKKKKRKASDDFGAPPTPKVAKIEARSVSTPKEAKSEEAVSAFQASLVGYLQVKGASPLSKLGNEVKKPAGLGQKLKAFLSSKSNIFAIDKDTVSLV